jgi:hypothetical protein
MVAADWVFVSGLVGGGCVDRSISTNCAAGGSGDTSSRLGRVNGTPYNNSAEEMP